MAPYHIRKYQERDHKRVLELFISGMEGNIPATFRHMLTWPQSRLLLGGVPLAMLLVSGSWLLAIVCCFTLLLFLWLYARYPWKTHVAKCLHTDMADISKHYLSTPGSCFWVAECGGQVVGMVAAQPLKDPPLGKKQLVLFRLTVAIEHRGEGIAKALVRSLLQFARDQGYNEVVLETSVVQQGALALYQHMGFRMIRKGCWDLTPWPMALHTIHLMYHISSQEKGL
ncbi:probable N-acetyltransferase CML1 [Perognathus longimembris pacificus]|uniref:probable N-acetyltransferase CML1 n=1 Tax=Perognathus longimembris pacificus TaxID=214514 RepID=UPI00201884B6|nr:probable N-acetyltransferase CML1 [Perognathus longimembris pacificus]XP_048208708.1 probable N-acetyltransferase CML1 [Perognathus longimembris pacificus]